MEMTLSEFGEESISKDFRREGLLEADQTRRDFHPHPTPKFAFKKTQLFPSAGLVGNVLNASPTTVNFSMSQPGSPGS